MKKTKALNAECVFGWFIYTFTVTVSKTEPSRLVQPVRVEEPESGSVLNPDLRRTTKPAKNSDPNQF